MCENDRVDFIDIDDSFEREEILTKYSMTSMEIRKTDYIPTMVTKGMVKQFSNEISVAVHSWAKLILEPYM
jgi:hypothetical protein